MSFKENPNAWNEIHDQLRDAMKSASSSMAYRLRDKLKRGSDRTGRQYPQYPARSSEKGQYPQEQFGDLRNSVDNRPAGESELLHAWDVGFFDEDMDKLYELELKPWDGQRKPLTMLVEDPETREEMAAAINENDFV